MMGDMSPTSVGRFIATAVATGWLITSSVKQDAGEVNQTRTSGARPTAFESVPPAQFTEKLRDRMRQATVPERGRNPFAYGARHSAPRQTEPSAAQPAVVTPPAAVEPPQPVFK